MHGQDNELEFALKRAHEDPAHRPEFYRTLMDSNIWVLGYIPGMKKGQTLLHTGEQLMIEQWQREDGKHVIPFFSSIPALQRAHESNHRGFTLRGQGLFQTMPGAHFVLNPNSSYYWEFHPEEVACLLKNGMTHVPEVRVLNEPRRIQLKAPEEYPAEMVASLSVLLAKYQPIQRAYVALMTELDPTPSNVLIVGLLANNDVDVVIQDMGAVIAITKPKQIPVDIVSIKLGECVFGKYFENTVPFYDARWREHLSSHSLKGHA